MAQDFAKNFDITFPLYTDPKRRSYRWAGFPRKLGLGVGAISQGIKAWRAGHRQAKVQGDALQQGGVLLIDQKGEVRWRHENQHAGDHASMDALLTAARGLMTS